MHKGMSALPPIATPNASIRMSANRRVDPLIDLRVPHPSLQDQGRFRRPSAIMASSCTVDIRSMPVVVASSSLGISDAITRTNATGSFRAAVTSAGLPEVCQASQRSRKNSSLSLLREPFGRPLGLPDWPGFQGINPRCLCFRSVESLSAAEAFDIGPIKPTSWLVCVHRRMSPRPTNSGWLVAGERFADR